MKTFHVLCATLALSFALSSAHAEEGVVQFEGGVQTGTAQNPGAYASFDGASKAGRVILSAGSDGVDQINLFRLRFLGGGMSDIPVGMDFDIRPTYASLTGMFGGGFGNARGKGSIGMKVGVFESFADEEDNNSLLTGISAEGEGLVNDWLAIGGSLELAGLWEPNSNKGGFLFSPSLHAKLRLGEVAFVKAEARADLYTAPYVAPDPFYENTTAADASAMLTAGAAF